MASERYQQSIELLNAARSMELHSIHQYMNQHYFLDGVADYGKLARVVKKIAIDEMRHAEQLAERISDLNGNPTAELADTVKQTDSVQDIYALAIEIEETTLEKYAEFAQICRENNDQVSATLFECLAAKEDKHYNYFVDVSNHIKELAESYLSKQIIGYAAKEDSSC